MLRADKQLNRLLIEPALQCRAPAEVARLPSNLRTRNVPSNLFDRPPKPATKGLPLVIERWAG